MRFRTSLIEPTATICLPVVHDHLINMSVKGFNHLVLQCIVSSIIYHHGYSRGVFSIMVWGLLKLGFDNSRSANE